MGVDPEPPPSHGCVPVSDSVPVMDATS